MSRVTWLAWVVVSAVMLAGCGGADTDEAAGDSSGSPTSQESPAEVSTTAELTLPTAAAGRCMAPAVESLRAQDTAFEGTVTALDEEEATLAVSTMYAGAPVDTVTVAVPGKDLADLILAVDFRQGETYLVSSLDGEVSVCGLSGPKDALLDGLYQEAYAG